MSPSTNRLDAIETNTSEEIEKTLREAASLVETEKFVEARVSLDYTMRLVARLNQLSYKRRFGRRELVERKVTYFTIWLTALQARLQFIESDFRDKKSFHLLTAKEKEASDLYHEFWNTPEYDALAKRIKVWRAAAYQRKVGATDV